MNTSTTTAPNSPWVLAARAAKMNPSVIREILKVTEKPGIISFAGGLPSPKTFPVAAFEQACAKVLREHFDIVPVRAEAEGARITLTAGFDAAAVRRLHENRRLSGADAKRF